MTNVPRIVTDTVALAGGRMVGRTRLQKAIYLLDQKGLNSGATFYYYNFGPFSDDVANGVVDSKFTGDLQEGVEYRQLDKSPYSVFMSEKSAEEIDRLGDLPADMARRLIERLSGVTSTVLELAATIHWLAFVEGVEDWWSELFRRKGAKAEGGRAEKALALLRELDLAPES